MTSVFFDTNALYIDGYRDSFAAGSLTFDINGSQIGVRVLHGSEYLVADDWTSYRHQDGSGFASLGDLTGYLSAQFAMRRPVGTVITPYQIAGVASFTVDHGLAYAPRTTVVDPDGAELDTDVIHAPGQTTLIFAMPFTGKLYLG